RSTMREHLESLSAREREVIARVTAGKLNKQIAAELGLSEVTVKVHRAKAMRKMRATSLAQLIKMVEPFDTTTAQDRPSSLERISLTGSWPVKRTKSAYADAACSLPASACSCRKRSSPSFTTNP